MSVLVAALFASAVDARSGSALDALSAEASRLAAATSGSTVVVAAPLVSDQPAPKGVQLALRIAALVAGRLGASARAHPQPAPLTTARAIAGRASTLVYVETEIARGDVRTTLDVYPSMANAWDRIRNPLPSPLAHAFASAKIDAEVRTFLTPLLLEQASVHKAHLDEGDVLAAACGDLDADGGDEHALVTRSKITTGRIVKDRYVAERTAPWSAVAPMLPVPMREPLATALVMPDALYVGLTDRGGVSLSADLVAHRPLRGLPATGADTVVCLTAEPSAGAFDGAPVACSPGSEAGPKMALPAPRFDALASARLADTGGNVLTFIALREPSGKLKLKAGDAARNLAGPFGAALAVGDLDQDGTPEIVTTGDGADDAVDVRSWSSVNSDPVPRLRLPAPSGVRALAVCPPERDGLPVLVAVVGDEIWLVRAASQRELAPSGTGAAPAGRLP